MAVNVNYWAASPKAFESLMTRERYARTSAAENGLDKKLLELVKIRVSQINGCAYCVDMHTKDSRTLGESEQRIYGLSVWRETPYFSDVERAVLAWTEALIDNQPTEVVEPLLGQMQSYFDDKSVVDLTLAICAINDWNMFTRAFGADVGSYEPGQFN